MKFTITMKDPDGPHDCIAEAAQDSVEQLPGLSPREREALIEVRTEELRDLCATWFRHGECLTLEIDTEARTCTVRPTTRSDL